MSNKNVLQHSNFKTAPVQLVLQNRPEKVISQNKYVKKIKRDDARLKKAMYK